MRADVFVRILTQTEIDIMDQEYPDLFPQKTAPIFAINAISSTMFSGHGYKKIRLYIDQTGQILKRFETN